jgi:hypothetical protein
MTTKRNTTQSLSEFAPPAVVEPQAVSTLPDGGTDKEGAMAKADLFKLSNYSYRLFKKIEDNDQLESWVQAKITKAADYIASVYHYLEYEMKFSEYGHKLDNSDVLSENQKTELRNKLTEARASIKALKLAQAQKMDEAKNPKTDKADKDYDDDGEIESSKDEVIGSRRKAAGLDETVTPVTKTPKIADKKGGNTPGAPKKKGTGGDEFKKALEKEMKEGAEKPSADLSKKEKSSVAKKAQKGGDIGKPGKNFDKVAKKAGGGEKGKKIAAAAMWKNIKESAEMAFGEGVYETGTDECMMSKEAKKEPAMKHNVISKGNFKKLEKSGKTPFKIEDASEENVEQINESTELSTIKMLSGL